MIAIRGLAQALQLSSTVRARAAALPRLTGGGMLPRTVVAHQRRAASDATSDAALHAALRKISRRVMMKGEPVRPKKTTGYTVFLREWYKDNQQPGGFTEGVREGAAAWAKTPEKQREYQVRAAEEAQQAKALWDAWFASLPDERKVKIDKWMAAAGTKNSTPPSKPKKSSWPSKPDLPLSRDAHGRPTRPKQNAHKYFHGEFWTEAKMKLGAKLSSQDTSRINGQASDAWQAMSDDQKKSYEDHFQQEMQAWVEWHDKMGFDPSSR